MTTEMKGPLGNVVQQTFECVCKTKARKVTTLVKAGDRIYIFLP
jgi:hypothetical protein